MKDKSRKRNVSTPNNKSAQRKGNRKTVPVQVPGITTGDPPCGSYHGEPKGGMLDEDNFEFEMRSKEELIEAEEELFERKWYYRKLIELEKIELGEIKSSPREVQGLLNDMRKLEQKYGKENLGPFDDWHWGYLNGKLATVRWALGDEWDFLDM